MRFGHGKLRIPRLAGVEGEVRRNGKVDKRTLSNKVGSKKNVEGKKPNVRGRGNVKKEVK